MNRATEKRIEGTIKDITSANSIKILTVNNGIHGLNVPKEHGHLMAKLTIGVRISVVMSMGKGRNRSIKSITTYSSSPLQ